MTPSFKEGLYHGLAFMGGTLFIAIFGTLYFDRFTIKNVC